MRPIFSYTAGSVLPLLHTAVNTDYARYDTVGTGTGLIYCTRMDAALYTTVRGGCCPLISPWVLTLPSYAAVGVGVGLYATT